MLTQAWKKIEETKKRAREILELRLRNQEKSRQIEERKRKQEEEVMQRKAHNQLLQQSMKDSINSNI